MEMIENFMTLEKCEYKSDYIPDDVWGDMESDAYDDMVFEKMNED